MEINMRRRSKLPELLSPAGDFRCLLAAVAAGADAVYVGGKKFGARAYAKNFDTDELSRAVRYCHLHGVRLYVTLNTLVYDRELSEAVEYARELYRIGVDAIIAADLGVISAIKRAVPYMEIHASTQMSVHNSVGADKAGELGISRVVLARELSLENIRLATETSSVEIEVFLHGALCVCHSGQCLFSSLVGGRSGNRGECAQPCRLPYDGGKYPLSLRDLSLASHIPELIESGVASLKIEGRMKSAEYVYTVTKIYRRLLDEGRRASAEEEEELRRAFSRGGFTDGYLTGRTDRNMTGVRSESDKESSRSIEEMTFEPLRIPISAVASFRLGSPSSLTLTDGRKTVTALGKAPVAAESSPLTEDSLSKRLAKMGNTFLSLSENAIQIELDEGINLSPADINALRREAAELFESQSREPSEIEYTPVKRADGEEKFLSALFLNATSYREAKQKSPALFDKLSYTFLPITEDIPKGAGVYIPPVVTDTELPEITSLLGEHRSRGVGYALCGNLSAIALASSLGLTPIGDFRLNVMNAESREAYRKMGVTKAILSPELTLPQARDVGGTVIGYGRIPLMLTERCFIKENYGCDSCGTAALTDRRGERFPMLREHRHRNLILNSKITYIGDKPEELLQNRIFSSHLLFTVESAEEISSVIKSYTEGAPLVGTDVRRIGGRVTQKDGSERLSAPGRRGTLPTERSRGDSIPHKKKPPLPKQRQGYEGKGSGKTASRQPGAKFKKNSQKGK